MWVHWLIEETKALLVFYDSFNALEINVTDIKITERGKHKVSGAASETPMRKL